MVASDNYSLFIFAAYAVSCGALGALLFASALRYALARKRLERAQKRQEGAAS